MENLLQLLLDLQEKRQLAVMMITHNLKTAERVSKKCALFAKGKVISGNTKDVLTRKNIKEAFSGVEESTVNFWFGHEDEIDD